MGTIRTIYWYWCSLSDFADCLTFKNDRINSGRVFLWKKKMHSFIILKNRYLYNQTSNIEKKKKKIHQNSGTAQFYCFRNSSISLNRSLNENESYDFRKSKVDRHVYSVKNECKLWCIQSVRLLILSFVIPCLILIVIMLRITFLGFETFKDLNNLISWYSVQTISMLKCNEANLGGTSPLTGPVSLVCTFYQLG